MSLIRIEGIWVRRVPPNNFLNIERHPSAGPQGGGGALYIEAPSSTVPALLELLGRDPAAGPGEFAVDTRVVGAPATSAPLVWNSKTGNRMRLFQNRQSGADVRHPAWIGSRGFPQAPNSITEKDEAEDYIADGLWVYVVRTVDDEFYAGFLVGPYPDDWPDVRDLRSLLTGNGGVKLFPSGLYLEPANQARPFRVSEDDTVIGQGGIVEVDDPADPPPQGRTAYASPEVAAEVDGIAMDLAVQYAEARFPDCNVQRMPHNNPGFDLLVSSEDAVGRYIEVKGTTHSAPRFWMTENERRFSEQNADIYTLVVFHSIDLDARTGVTVDRDGEVPGEVLQVAQWRGELP